MSTASKTSKPITLEALAADIDRRRAETGVTDLPRNGGNRRTARKRALLAAIDAAGGKWGGAARQVRRARQGCRPR